MYWVSILVNTLTSCPKKGEIITQILPQIDPSAFYRYVVHTSQEDVRGFVGYMWRKCLPDWRLSPAHKLKDVCNYSP